MSAIIVTNVTPDQYGEVQKYRVYYYPQLSVVVTYSNTVAGSATYAVPLLSTGRAPLYAGLSNVSLPANAYLQSVSLSGSELSLVVYFSNSTSGTLTFSALVVQ